MHSGPHRPKIGRLRPRSFSRPNPQAVADETIARTLTLRNFRITAEVSPERLVVPGKRTCSPEDHRQSRAPRRTDRLRHPRKTFRLPLRYVEKKERLCNAEELMATSALSFYPVPIFTPLWKKLGLPEAIESATKRETATYDPAPVIFRRASGNNYGCTSLLQPPPRPQYMYF